MANIKDFIKKIGNETVSLEEQQQALAAVEQTIVQAKAKREESIGKNVDLVISALKKIESDLNTKLIELNNTPAKQGVSGPQGEKGRDGRDGKDGYKGQDGKDGVDGQDGKDGEAGISVTDAKVDFDGSLVITLSDGREIDAGTVISSDVAKNIHSVQTAGTGSTSQAVLDAIAAIQATLATYGTMATQNANAVAITGGTINGTTVGGTISAAGTFTTITGQTARLNGTGNNLILQSNTFTTAPWATTASTIATTVATTDPTGGSNAWIITNDATLSRHQIQQAFTSVSGITYTFSCYGKNNDAGYLYLRWASSNKTVVFNLSTGAVGTTDSGITASISNAGNGWYRCIATYTTAITADSLAVGLAESDSVATYTGTGKSIYIYGSQLEVSNTANTYIPTTTTAVYGTPTLSFSGVSEIGLLSNGALYLQPAGTGALQAQATTSTATGGNIRGANAVDWQTVRGSAAQVANGQYAVVAGGQSNTSSAFGGTVGGGTANTVTNSYSVIAGGYLHTNSGQYAFIGSGYGNQSNGYYNFIGGGFVNTGTANAAVTTQATTNVTSGSTAVTLSASNAAIKVGQVITGTGINTLPHTYVAAISGTTLTLSQNASATGTPTLSFFTPHGVVVGGGNNQATGSYSFIGGGGDAGTAANRNTASGDWSTVGGGVKNTASGIASVVVGGGASSTGIPSTGNTASGTSSFVGGGNQNSASGTYSSILGGFGHTANSLGSSVLGGYAGSTRSIAGNTVFTASTIPIANIQGITQAAMLVLARETTDATATALASNNAAASGTNQVILPNNSAYFFTGEVVSGVTGGGNTKGWTIEGVIKRGANAGTTALVGTPTVTSLYADAGAATWALAVTADTTNGGIRVTFTGQASTTIRTVCQIRTTEMTY
jgi:hypothetical protein